MHTKSNEYIYIVMGLSSYIDAEKFWNVPLKNSCLALPHLRLREHGGTGGRKILKAIEEFSVRYYVFSSIRSYVYNVSSTRLYKHELSKDDTNGHAKGVWGNPQKPQLCARNARQQS